MRNNFYYIFKCQKAIHWRNKMEVEATDWENNIATVRWRVKRP